MAEEQERRTPARFLGSLRDALLAASQEDDTAVLKPQRLGLAPDAKTIAIAPTVLQIPPPDAPESSIMSEKLQPSPSAAEAAREARGGTPLVPSPAPSGAPAPASTPAASADRHVEFDHPPTTRVVRGAAPKPTVVPMAANPDRTTLVRGKQQVTRGAFHQDPVVGWLVIVGGPGLGAFRPIFEGNNTVGRNSNQRIPIDFGDDAISSEEQAYIRYDSTDRTFLFVPNMSKTNVVSLNEKRPTSAVTLAAMDLITIGRTQLVFVPFCSPDFDWSEMADLKS